MNRINKRLLLTLLLGSNSNYLINEPRISLENSMNINQLLLINKDDTTLINKDDTTDENEEECNKEFLDILKKEFSSEELMQFQEPFEQRLKKIPAENKKNNDGEVLKAIEYMKYARYIALGLKYNIHPVEVITKVDLDALEMQNFRENTSSFKAERKIKALSKKWIITTKNIINQIIDSKTKLITVASIRDPNIKKIFIEEKEKFDNILALFNSFEKLNKIGEKEWFDLFAMKDIGLESIEKDIVESIPSISKNERKKKLLCLVDITKIVKSNVFQGISVPAVSSIDENVFFDNLEKIYKLAEEFVYYKEYISQKQISIKNIFKYLQNIATNETKEKKDLKNFTLDNEISKSVFQLKFSDNHANDLERSLKLWLINHNKASSEQLNRQDDVGTISYKDISSNRDKYDSNIPFNYFLDIIQLYTNESEDNSIDSKSFIKFKNENNKNNSLSQFKNIDEMIKFIDQTIYNPRFITILNNEISINSKYLKTIESKIIEWEEIKNKFIEINNSIGFNNYINLIKTGTENIKDKYLLQAIFSNKYSSVIIGEYIRTFAAKFIKKELPESSQVTINSNIEKILFTDIEILPRNFEQFNRQGSLMEAKKEVAGINGNPGAGKSLIAKNFIINCNLARVFGKVPSAKMQIAPDIDLKKIAIALIRNQGEIPGELSNHETNSLVFRRLMEFLEERKEHAIIFCDEILSGTNPTSAERMINKNSAIKELIYTGKLSLWSIEHNEETRNSITTRDICLTFDLRDIRSGKNKIIIDEKSYKKEHLFESDNQDLFNAFLDKKFFGSKNIDQSNMTIYFEIDKNNECLKKITNAEYEKIIKRNPQNAISYTYTPLLNNLQNHHDRSGNVTYDDRDKKLIFNQPTMLFTSNNKKYMAILSIKPEFRNDEIIYHVANVIKFYDINFLVKRNSNIITIDKHQQQSYEDMDAHLLLSKDSNLQDVANEKIEEEHAKRINKYLEKKGREAEMRYNNEE